MTSAQNQPQKQLDSTSLAAQRRLRGSGGRGVRARFAHNLLFLFCLAYTLAMFVFLGAWVIAGERLWWVGLLINFLPLIVLPPLILFPLALIARARRAALVVLPLVVGTLMSASSYYVPRSAPAVDPAWTLRVITLNISDSRLPFAQVEAWLLDHPADLVVLQEIPHPLNAFMPRLAELYPYMVQQQLRNSIAFLSRYPLTRSEGFDIPEPGFTYAPRVLMQVNGEEIAVYGTSLPAPVRSKGRVLLPDVHVRAINQLWDLLFGYDDDLREWELHNLLLRVEADPLPLIIAGDMNLVEWSADYRRVASLLSDSFREAGIGLGFTFPAFEAFGLPAGLTGLMRIDYVWHSGEFVALDARYGDYVGSDHLPVLVTLARR